MIETGKLLDQARERSGLSDFGEEDFLEPLSRLVDSINRECELSPIGEQSVPEMLLTQLVNRLEIESWYARHPEIDDEQIVAPVFTASLPRTGTTALGFIMAQDPETRVLRNWEAYHPCPPPESATEHNDPRIAVAQRESDGLEAMVPELVNMLPRSVTGPEECYIIKSYAFSAYGFDAIINVPSYVEWLVHSKDVLLSGYRYHRRVLKLLQWHCPPRRWSLRTPEHLFSMDAIDEVYPDARFIMTHRDPAKALASVCSLLYEIRRAHVLNPQPEAHGKRQQEYWALGLERALAFRDRVGEARFFDISHKRQVIDPAEQIRPLYEKLGWDYDDGLTARIKQWQEGTPRRPHPVSPGFFGLDPEDIAQRYRFYSERFAAFL
ncbi:MAG: sulfotransferase [Gammaproteobacteria bacterium]|nr:sulfotransferase [Gammaproteobacteria bacterium]